MIQRRVEYVIACDVEDCRQGYWNARDWTTRQDCEEYSLREGWVKMTYNRWACPECAKRLGFVRTATDASVVCDTAAEWNHTTE